MEDTFSYEFKKKFLFLFTRELVKHSLKELAKLRQVIESEEKRRFVPMPKIPEKERKEVPVFASAVSPKQVAHLFIPAPRLPAHLEYLKPIPAPVVEIDLVKLNPLVRDPAVRIIEVSPDEKVIVTGTMGIKPTGIILNKEDIKNVISKFSEVSKIPANEGVYRVAVGNLVFSAIISEVVGSKFIINKMAYPSQGSFQNIPVKKNNLK